MIAALYRALRADSGLADLVGARVFEHVPARARMPYVVIGREVSRPWSTDRGPGRETEVTVHVWTRGARRADTERIVARVRAAASFERLAGENPNIVNVVPGTDEVERLPERDLVHAQLRLRIKSEEDHP